MIKNQSDITQTEPVLVPAKSIQSCPTLGNPIDCSPPGSSGHAWDSPGKNTGVSFCARLQGIWRKNQKEKGHPLKYPDLENSMDCIVHGVTKSQTWLSSLHYSPQYYDLDKVITERRSLPGFY